MADINPPRKQNASRSGALKIVEGKTHAKLMQNGVVLSHLRRFPGPSHTLFDVLAGCLTALAPGPRAAILGFAAGGILPALCGMQRRFQISAVDLEDTGHRFFKQTFQGNIHPIRFARQDAVKWLSYRKGRFDAVLEDLSGVEGRSVVKPALCHETLPGLILDKLAAEGVAVFNFFPPWNPSWKIIRESVRDRFPVVHCLYLEDYYNRILIAGNHGYSAREITHRLLCALDIIRSRQADRFSVRTVKGGG